MNQTITKNGNKVLIPKNYKINIDKVERRWISEIKTKDPGFQGLEDYHVAKILLKEALFTKIREINSNKGPIALLGLRTVYFWQSIKIKLIILKYKLTGDV